MSSPQKCFAVMAPLAALTLWTFAGQASAQQCGHHQGGSSMNGPMASLSSMSFQMSSMSCSSMMTSRTSMSPPTNARPSMSMSHMCMSQSSMTSSRLGRFGPFPNTQPQFPMLQSCSRNFP